METILNFICLHAHDAHWIIFGLIMLAGLNVPISEDVLLIIAGALAGTCLESSWLNLYIWVVAACIFSAYETYWIGRLFGPKLYKFKWFNRILTPQKVEKLHHYYNKFGILTFIVGRMIPGGVRNALFMTAGLGKMPFLTFVLRDAVGAFFSATLIFSLGYWFGEHHKMVIHFFHTYNVLIICGIITIIGVAMTISRYKKRTKTTIEQP